jgi:predicted nucleic acid-binding protein
MTVGPALAETSLVLDNNILTAWRYQKRAVVEAITAYQSRLKFLPALTSMTVYEALYGFENSQVKSNQPNERTGQDRISTEQLIKPLLKSPPTSFRASRRISQRIAYSMH